MTPSAPLAMPPPQVDGGQVDRLVDDVLRRPAFVDAQPSWLSELRDDVRTWFLDRLADVFASGAGTAIAWTLLGAAAILAVWLTARATRRLAPGGGTVDVPTVALHPARRPAEWLADARSAAGSGQHAEAVRCAYRAVVAALASRGDVEEVPGRTVGEYRTRLATSGSSDLSRFGEVADLFERAWYARRPVAAGEVDVALGHATHVVEGRG